MGGVSIRRGLNSQFVVVWGKPPLGAAGLSAPGGKRRAVDSGNHALPPLTISDKDFEAKFADGCWTVSWRWRSCWRVLLESTSVLVRQACIRGTPRRSKVGSRKVGWLRGMAQLRASFLFWLLINQPRTRLGR